MSKQHNISGETRTYMDDWVRRILRRPDMATCHAGKANNLAGVVSRILMDKDVFTFLSMFLTENHGLKVGTFSYWDDIRVTVTYGLTIDHKSIPKNTRIFLYEELGRDGPMYTGRLHHLQIQTTMPTQKQVDACGVNVFGYPTPGGFAASVDDALRNGLKNPERYSVDLSLARKGF